MLVPIWQYIIHTYNCNTEIIKIVIIIIISIGYHAPCNDSTILIPILTNLLSVLNYNILAIIIIQFLLLYLQYTVRLNYIIIANRYEPIKIVYIY